MTLRIELLPEGPSTTIRLIGRIRAEHLDELKAQIEASRKPVVLDLEELNLVDAEGVRFLGTCLVEGIRLVNCSPYINNWIAQEHGRGSCDSEL
jgi:anti-anti-sigma regulatory factor